MPNSFRFEPQQAAILLEGRPAKIGLKAFANRLRT
jgi:hypothetical protein